MNHRIHPSLAAVVLSLALAACGGGRGDAPADVFPSPAPPVAASGSLIDFLLFPNPLKLDDGTAQSNTLAYAESYYAAIDPQNERTTFAAWKTKNRFDQPNGRQVAAAFGDFRDLGYGRRMTARQNLDDNSIAFFVENYLVDTGGGGYGSGLNLDAAIVQDRRWQANINAIEFSPGPGGTVKFAKFFSFDPVTGARRLEQDIDGRGPKSLPGLCISCHGGRADALEPLGAALPPARFAFLANSAEPAQRGDTRGKLHVFELDTLTFSTRPGFTRPEQEAALKAMNEIVLCSYPMVGGPPAAPSKNACRPTATTNNTEWQGTTAATLIQGAYGGIELPNDKYAEPVVPAGWATQEALYTSVVVPACRSCHIVRGTGGTTERQSDIDLTTVAKFDSYADRIKAHVFDRGNMPLAKIVFDRFWSSGMAERLATYLDSKGVPPARDGNGQPLRPGRPIADPGPDRVANQGATPLSAKASLYASRYQWTLLPSATASIAGADTATPTFTATADGTYFVDLVAINGTLIGSPTRLKIVVKAALAPNPQSIRLTDIRNALSTAPAGETACTGCHTMGGAPPTAFTAVDDNLFYSTIRGMLNLTDISASPLLRKPSGNHHGANHLPTPEFKGFDALAIPGDPTRDRYDVILNWALNRAPQ